MGNQSDTKDDSRKWRTIPGKEGIIYREHASRKHGKRADRFIAIRYRSGSGKRSTETLGWTSDGYSVDKAIGLLREFKENIRTGVRPQSLKEKREMAENARREEARLAQRAKLQIITFGELAELYIVWAKENRISGKDVEALLRNHVLGFLGERQAGDITSTDINELRKRLESTSPKSGRRKNDEAARLSPGTVIHVLKTVREVYNFALETPAPSDQSVMLFQGLNPARMTKRGRGVRPPTHDHRRLRILNDEEIQKLLAYKSRRTEYAELHDMMLLFLDTGPRDGELAHLKKESIDSVSGAVRFLKGSDADRSTKGGMARIVHAGQLFPECLDMLKKRLAAPSVSPYLFPGKTGGARNTDAISRAMSRIAKKLGFNEGVTDPRNIVVLHTLRHTFATRMLEAGCDIYTLKELMGHESVKTTEGYLHLCNRAKREQALARIRHARDKIAEEEAQRRAKAGEEQ